jgi:hypothetical protein
MPAKGALPEQQSKSRIALLQELFLPSFLPQSKSIVVCFAGESNLLPQSNSTTY